MLEVDIKKLLSRKNYTIEELKNAQDLKDKNIEFIKKFEKENLYIFYEELSELEQQLLKELRNKGNRYLLLEELVDVYLCVEVLEETRNFYNEFKEMTNFDSLEETFKQQIEKDENILESVLKNIVEFKKELYSYMEYKNFYKEKIIKEEEQANDVFLLDKKISYSLLLVLKFLEVYFSFDIEDLNKVMVFKIERMNYRIKNNNY